MDIQLHDCIRCYHLPCPPEIRVFQVSPFSCAWLEDAPWWKWCASSHCAAVDHQLACLSRLWLLHWHSPIGISFCHVTLRSFYQSCDFCMNFKTTVNRHRRICLVMRLEECRRVLLRCGWQHSVSCRTLQTDLLLFHIGKQSWEIRTTWVCFCIEPLTELDRKFEMVVSIVMVRDHYMDVTISVFVWSVLFSFFSPL